MNSTAHSASSSMKAMNADERLAAFTRVRATTLALATPLSPEDCAAQSMPDASPVKWHLAHTTWFFETFVLSALSDYTPFDDRFGALFNSYYNALGEQHARALRSALTRPSLDDILDYRRHVDEALAGLLARGSQPPGSLQLIELGLHHEQQHQELILTDIKHLFAQNPLQPVYRRGWPLTSVRPAPQTWIAFEGGVTSIGAADEGFAFDHERPRHDVLLAPYELASRPVTNGEFIAFIEDGGYRRPALWLDAGWEAVRGCGWTAPAYWRDEGDEWTCFTLHGRRPVDVHAPVCHISFYEAEAFARWAGARLPTEAEWERAAAGASPEGNFLERGAFHPLALDGRHADNHLAQMFGDVWEWTRSDFAPYPGYAPPEDETAEYNGKFMSGRYVLRGGSCATPQAHIRAAYRNFFPPEARWQFSGLRLARDAKGASRSSSTPPQIVTTRNAAPDGADERNALIAGLERHPAVIPPKYFYDSLGSRLFEAITQTPEYYPTRTEAAIFDSHRGAIARMVHELIGDAFTMIDIGAGNCEKAASLFEALQPARYAPVDISADFLRQSVEALAARFPRLPITGVATDFAGRLDLPAELTRGPKLFFYPGSSLGNFDRADARRFLERLASFPGRGALLIGLDLVKDRHVLESAYDDAAGVTAAFNRNILRGVNRALGADFVPEDWRHCAVFDPDAARIEMRLVARKAMKARWPGGGRAFDDGEFIITEHSHKWTPESLRELLRKAGFAVAEIWTDPKQWFAVVLAHTGY